MKLQQQCISCSAFNHNSSSAGIRHIKQYGDVPAEELKVTALQEIHCCCNFISFFSYIDAIKCTCTAADICSKNNPKFQMFPFFIMHSESISARLAKEKHLIRCFKLKLNVL